MENNFKVTNINKMDNGGSRKIYENKKEIWEKS